MWQTVWQTCETKLRRPAPARCSTPPSPCRLTAAACQVPAVLVHCCLVPAMCHVFGACRAVQSATCRFAGISCRGTLYVAPGLALPQDFSDESDNFRHFFLEKLGEPSSQRQLEGVALHAYAMRNAALRIACRVSMLCLAPCRIARLSQSTPSPGRSSRCGRAELGGRMRQAPADA